MTASPYIIAEVGSVHDGSYGNACKLIEAAAACGADAVKFQTHIAEAETLTDAPSPGYFSTEPRQAYFRRTGFSKEQWKGIAKACADAGVEFLSSPFSIEAVDLLEEIGMQTWKIPSGEVSNTPLLEAIAAIGKPVLLSSGMSGWAELDAAVAILRGKCDVTVLQCTSAYPCPPEQVGLNVMVEMGERYGLPFGYSDHTTGFAGPIAAVSLGASVIEKHFTFSRLMYGSDAQHSMEPDDFRILCAELRDAAVMRVSSVDKDNLEPFRDMKRIFEKSIVAASDLPAGAIIGREHLAFKKPGDGIPARLYEDYLGREIARAVKRDHQFRDEDFK